MFSNFLSLKISGMSSLEKLAIRGVRSFDPGDYQVIEFTKPLTVIVGENGSGKTVCIDSSFCECWQQ